MPGMDLPDEVESAVESAVRNERQPRSVADKLISWLERIASGAESITDEESVRRHLEVLFEAVEVEAVQAKES